MGIGVLDLMFEPQTDLLDAQLAAQLSDPLTDQLAVQLTDRLSSSFPIH